MTNNVIRKAVLRTVRLDDDVWEAVKGMESSLNVYLRAALLGDVSENVREVVEEVERVGDLPRTVRGVIPDNDEVEVQGRLKCKHCGRLGVLPADAKALRPCAQCWKNGHQPFEPCAGCVKDQHQKELAEKHGTENVDYNAEWGA
jgi:hypothetical protein